MDELETLLNELEGVPVSVALHATRTALEHRAELLASIESRPEPWFFRAGPGLTAFATRGEPGTGSAPHTHGLWAVIACLGGQEGSRLYGLRDGVLTETGTTRLAPGDAHALGDDVIHATFNCWTEPNVVLHLYGGDFLSMTKQVFDPLSGEAFALGLAEPLVPVDAAR